MKSTVMTKHKIIILCAGDGSRWNNFLGLPKQLIPINGEALLHRMVRLCHEHNITDISIVTHNKKLESDGATLFHPPLCRWTAETLLSTKEMWSSRTTILLGDVFYTESAMKKILTTESPLQFFGRPSASNYTFTPYGELFALCFSAESVNTITNACCTVIADGVAGGKGKLWQLYRSIVGAELNQHHIEKDFFFPIHDFTDDIDSPEEYEKVIKRYEMYTSYKLTRIMLLSYLHTRRVLGKIRRFTSVMRSN